MTKDGIEYDFRVSPYVIDIPYKKGHISYIFSSEMYKEKFLNHMISRKPVFEKRFLKRGVKLNMSAIDDLLTYIDIEKRGFRIEILEDFCGTVKVFERKEDLNLKILFEFI
jgi:hypothetical protein